MKKSDKKQTKYVHECTYIIYYLLLLVITLIVNKQNDQTFCMRAVKILIYLQHLNLSILYLRRFHNIKGKLLLTHLCLVTCMEFLNCKFKLYKKNYKRKSPSKLNLSKYINKKLTYNVYFYSLCYQNCMLIQWPIKKF